MSMTKRTHKKNICNMFCSNAKLVMTLGLEWDITMHLMINILYIMYRVLLSLKAKVHVLCKNHMPTPLPLTPLPQRLICILKFIKKCTVIWIIAQMLWTRKYCWFLCLCLLLFSYFDLFSALLCWSYSTWMFLKQYVLFKLHELISC